VAYGKVRDSLIFSGDLEMGMITRVGVILSLLLLAGGTVKAAELEIPTKKHRVAPGYQTNPMAKQGRYDVHAQREKTSPPVIR
jgi:hypothetical protein